MLQSKKFNLYEERITESSKQQMALLSAKTVANDPNPSHPPPITPLPLHRIRVRELRLDDDLHRIPHPELRPLRWHPEPHPER